MAFKTKVFNSLLDLFFAGSLSDVSETFALAAAKRLYLMRSFLLETTWRAQNVAVDLLSSLRTLISHPYKQVV